MQEWIIKLYSIIERCRNNNKINNIMIQPLKRKTKQVVKQKVSSKPGVQEKREITQNEKSISQNQAPAYKMEKIQFI